MDDQTGKERLYHQEVLKVVANSERSERHERLKKDEDMARKAIVDERLNDRLLRLIEEHKDQDGKIKDWSNIMAQLNTEGFRNSKGQPWNRPAIQNYYQRLKNEGLVESAELVAGTQKPEGIVESPQQDEPKVPYLTEHS
ncbi:MAG TPA: hypothetical protein VK463_05770, partial [Desulfomonilaceae bacterium]|nr:hypothetical protein [Desulfomonilaceae bacterium]